MGLTKAKILIEHTGEQFEVMFNPEEYSLNKDNNFASHSVPGLSSPLLQFVNGNLRTLEMELFFDTTDARRDVREETGRVVGLLDIRSDLHAPPVLRVSWASLQFRCVLARASQKFTRFLEDGRPTRARVSVSFSEFLDEGREAKEVNRLTVDFTKSHIVLRGESIFDIAFAHYKDPQLWRSIAEANELDDPRVLVAGESLRIPSLTAVRRL
jgi:hypothetical protein